MTIPAKKGLLTVIGTGPGSPEYLIPAAKQEIEASGVVVGYAKYLRLIAPLLEGKEIYSTSMRRETDRVARALEIAAGGRRVCIISSGDAGVYGMAGLTLEMLHDRSLTDKIEVRVLPGITAATSCASLLGAPLMHDFCVISLSDLLTPPELIEKRLRMAAEGDFVTVLYNPKSSKRVELIETARKTFLQHRSGTTPVGIVNDAYRDTCAVRISSLEDLADQYPEINMCSTVIIGNSSTIQLGTKMVTPRGYKLSEETD